MHHRHKRRIAHSVILLIVILMLAFFVYSIVNYRVMRNQLTSGVEKWQYTSVFISSFILESFPSIIGPGTPFTAAMLVKLDFKYTLIILLISTTLSALLSYFLGFKYSEEVLKFVSPKTRKDYERLFKKYGKATMIITAVTALPYIPSLAGVFKMKFKYFLFVVTSIRILNYFFISTVIYYAVNYNWLGFLAKFS